MADAKSSSLDADVAAILANTAHTWELATVNGATQEYCIRCSKSKSEVRKPDDAYAFLPCRGFIG